MQLGCEFGAGRASPDNRDMQLAGTYWRVLHMRADAGVGQPPVEAHRLLRGLQRDGVLLHAGGPKIIGGAADGDDERIVTDTTPGSDLAPFLIIGGRKQYLLPRPV